MSDPSTTTTSVGCMSYIADLVVVAFVVLVIAQMLATFGVLGC